MNRKFYRKLDKELGKYGIVCIRDKIHRMYRGVVNGKTIIFCLTKSPHTHMQKHIHRNVRKTLKDAGVKNLPDLRM